MKKRSNQFNPAKQSKSTCILPVSLLPAQCYIHQHQKNRPTMKDICISMPLQMSCCNDFTYDSDGFLLQALASNNAYTIKQLYWQTKNHEIHENFNPQGYPVTKYCDAKQTQPILVQIKLVNNLKCYSSEYRQGILGILRKTFTNKKFRKQLVCFPTIRIKKQSINFKLQQLQL